MVDFLQTNCPEVESRKRKLDAAWDSVSVRMREVDYRKEALDKRQWDLEERERRFFVFEDMRTRELASHEEELEHRHAVVDKRVQLLKAAEDEVGEFRRRAGERFEAARESLRFERGTLAEKEERVDVMINALKEKEGEFNLFLQEKMRGIALKQENLDKKLKEFGEQARLADEKSRNQQLFKHCFMERIEVAENKLEHVRLKMDDKFEEIECRDNAGWESLALSIKEADLVRESVEKKLEELEKMKAEFTSFQEEKNRELASKEQLLDAMSEKLVKDVELRNQELIEREKLGHSLLERLELAKDNVEGLKTSVDNRFYEADKKMRKLASEEQLLDSRSEKIFTDAKVMSEELIEREKLGRQLLDRLCSVKDYVEGLKARVDQRFIEVGLKETDVDSIRNLVEKKMDEADLKERELEEQERRIAEKEGSLISKEKELEDRHNVRSEKLDSREKNLNSVRELTRNCFKEHLAIKRELRTEKNLVEKRCRDLDVRELRLNHAQEELEFKEKQMRDSFKLLEYKQHHPPDVFNAPIEIEPDESADLKFMVRMDGKTLQMFLNDGEKEFKSMDDEIFKVLHLSSDPAKLVLDAMTGFYPPRLREEDVEYNVRRTCIILLGQLIKLSPTIKPHVREEAIELATSWKSQSKDAPQNAKSQEVLGFLCLLTAFDLASYFDEDDLSSFLMVGQYKEALGLQ
ncbi:trichohyalin-like isoform X2 [Salvia divinorum]|uniref:FRIGIDA-like protein n=1 Tax=Salvia divinorum TaxID=28513 RepID=A0ABD1G7H9_SALDI